MSIDDREKGNFRIPDEKIIEGYNKALNNSTNKRRIKKQNKKKGTIKKAIILVAGTIIVLASNVPNTLKEGKRTIISNIATESMIPMMLMDKTNINDIIDTTNSIGFEEGYSPEMLSTYLESRFNISLEAYNNLTTGPKVTQLGQSLSEYGVYLNGMDKNITNSRGGK